MDKRESRTARCFCLILAISSSLRAISAKRCFHSACFLVNAFNVSSSCCNCSSLAFSFASCLAINSCKGRRSTKHQKGVNIEENKRSITERFASDHSGFVVGAKLVSVLDVEEEEDDEELAAAAESVLAVAASWACF